MKVLVSSVAACAVALSGMASASDPATAAIDDQVDHVKQLIELLNSAESVSGISGKEEPPLPKSNTPAPVDVPDVLNLVHDLPEGERGAEASERIPVPDVVGAAGDTKQFNGFHFYWHWPVHYGYGYGYDSHYHYHGYCATCYHNYFLDASSPKLHCVMPGMESKSLCQASCSIFEQCNSSRYISEDKSCVLSSKEHLEADIRTDLLPKCAVVLIQENIDSHDESDDNNVKTLPMPPKPTGTAPSSALKVVDVNVDVFPPVTTKASESLNDEILSAPANNLNENKEGPTVASQDKALLGDIMPRDAEKFIPMSAKDVELNDVSEPSGKSIEEVEPTTTTASSSDQSSQSSSEQSSQSGSEQSSQFSTETSSTTVESEDGQPSGVKNLVYAGIGIVAAVPVTWMGISGATRYFKRTPSTGAQETDDESDDDVMDYVQTEEMVEEAVAESV